MSTASMKSITSEQSKFAKMAIARAKDRLMRTLRERHERKGIPAAVLKAVKEKKRLEKQAYAMGRIIDRYQTKAYQNRAAISTEIDMMVQEFEARLVFMGAEDVLKELKDFQKLLEKKFLKK